MGVFLAYVCPAGQTLINRRLYLPQSRARDDSKRRKAGVPNTVNFATKPQLARQMLQSAFESGLRPGWVVADEVYGNDGKFWWWLEQQHQRPYLLTVNSQHSVFIGYQEYRAKVLAQSLQAQQWQRLSCGYGTKGERLYDWAWIEVNSAKEKGFSRWLLFRRNLKKPDVLTPSPTIRCMHQLRQPSKKWFGWQVNDGGLKNVLPLPKTNWDSANTKCGLGKGGIGI